MQAIKVGWKEDVKVTLLNEECGARDGEILETGLNNWCVNTRDRIRQ